MLFYQMYFLLFCISFRKKYSYLFSEFLRFFHMRYLLCLIYPQYFDGRKIILVLVSYKNVHRIRAACYNKYAVVDLAQTTDDISVSKTRFLTCKQVL